MMLYANDSAKVKSVDYLYFTRFLVHEKGNDNHKLKCYNHRVLINFTQFN